MELDNGTNYVTCRWIDNPDPSPTESLPDSFDLIPDSEPSNSTAASVEKVGSSEQDLASVPSTVQVGLPGTSDRERYSAARPARSPGGTCRNSDGSWSLKNFDYSDDEEAPQDAPPG